MTPEAIILEQLADGPKTRKHLDGVLGAKTSHALRVLRDKGHIEAYKGVGYGSQWNRGSWHWRLTHSRPTGGVYFIQGIDGGLVKIGWCKGSPERRCKDLQCGSPVLLRVIGWVPGAQRTEEAELHRRFAHWRRHGEWFVLTPELERLIGIYAVRPGDPYAREGSAQLAHSLPA